MIRLEMIDTPHALSELSADDLILLSQEIREKIINTVSDTGGHLSSNLGMVELTIAIHCVFNAPNDKIIFDVGHQAYTHKLLTGRYDQFHTLRCFEGLSGFPKPSESKYDCFATGHASTAISAALGMARARDLCHETYHVVAVVGDGSLTGGMSYEALNDAGSIPTRLIVILNDNEMSISRSVGAVSQYLSHIRGSIGYRKTKSAVKKGLSKLPFFERIARILWSAITSIIKKLFSVKDDFFHTLGFRYLGPVDGHRISSLTRILRQAMKYDEPVIVHCVTKKGKGYKQAEKKPDAYHGTAPFYIESGRLKDPTYQTYAETLGNLLTQLAQEDDKIVAITAAMAAGTGLRIFGDAFPNRFFDVGIAEQHGVVLAAGLAAAGAHPYMAVYSSFLQRGYDPVLHDVCIQNLPVCFLIDRAGLVNGDGETHQGVYDISYLRHIPNMTLFSPRDLYEFELIIKTTAACRYPRAIRYPCFGVDLSDDCPPSHFVIGRWETLVDGQDAVLLTFGSMIPVALTISHMFAEEHIAISVVNCSTLKPLDAAWLLANRQSRPIFTLEEHIISCGFGSSICEFSVLHGLPQPVWLYGLPDEFIHQGCRNELLEYYKLTPKQIHCHMRQKMIDYRCSHETGE